MTQNKNLFLIIGGILLLMFVFSQGTQQGLPDQQAQLILAPTGVCVDSDNGDITLAGSATKGFGTSDVVTYDYCSTDKVLAEAWCGEGAIDLVDCTELGFLGCRLGACTNEVGRADVCQSTDGGDISKRGTTTGPGVSLTDECLDSFHVLEYSCFGEDKNLKETLGVVDTPIGVVRKCANSGFVGCSNGACTTEKPQQTPVTSTGDTIDPGKLRKAFIGLGLISLLSLLPLWLWGLIVLLFLWVTIRGLT